MSTTSDSAEAKKRSLVTQLQVVPSLRRLGDEGTNRREQKYSNYYQDCGRSPEKEQERENAGLVTAAREKRKENARDLAESYYHLVTDFYEYGYGQSFHFAPVIDSLSMDECITQYQKGLGNCIKAKQGMKILDAGCGVGGPGRELARSFGCQVVGLNCSDYQLTRADMHTQKAQLSHLCSYVKGDYSEMSFDDNSFDGAIAIESICHSKDPLVVYKELYRVLKPGAIFTESAWALTDSYDPNNQKHVSIRNGILVGSGIPELRTEKELLDCIRQAGLEVIEFVDAAEEGNLPWHTFLVGKGYVSLQGFRTSTIGRWTTHFFLTALEFVGMAPRGSTKVHSILLTAADSLIESAKAEIFTPMFRIVARKPAV